MVGYLSGTRCKWFACGTGDATATLSSRALLITKMVNLPFWCQLAQVVLENKPLNGVSLLFIHICTDTSGCYFGCVLYVFNDYPVSSSYGGNWSLLACGTLC